jgi:RNA polymerase sigma-70 factor, ECF subfamily
MLQTISDILLDQQQLSDHELVKLAQQGEFSAFTTLYERHFPSVYNRVRYVIPEPDVEDITQEIFVAMLKSLKSFKYKSQFSTWLRTLTNRTVADYYRRRERNKYHLNLNLDTMNLLETQKPASGRSTSKIDECVVLRQGILALPEHYQDVILLRFAEGMRFHEIAVERCQSLEATKSLFRRALAALRKQLAEGYD